MGLLSRIRSGVHKKHSGSLGRIVYSGYPAAYQPLGLKINRFALYHRDIKNYRTHYKRMLSCGANIATSII